MLFKILGGVNNYVTSVTFTYSILFLKIPSINPRNTQWKITAPPTCTRQNSGVYK